MAQGRPRPVMGVAELQRVRRDAYLGLDRQAQIGLAGWSAFTATFAAARAVTHAIRAERGPFRNFSAGERHLHHYLWGILMLSGAGGAALAKPPTDDYVPALAAVYGAGAALVVDECALLLDLSDVYWTDRGRISVNVGVGVIAVLGSYLAAPPFWRRIARAQREAVTARAPRAPSVASRRTL
jgi:hypothetical protein